MHNQSNDLIKLQTNFNNLQKEFIEEKEKNVNLEKKNVFLENELKQMDKVGLFKTYFVEIILENSKIN